MWSRYWYTFVIILLSIGLPIGLCEFNHNERSVTNRNGKFRMKSLIPLRDDSDYKNDEQNFKNEEQLDNEYDDEYGTYDETGTEYDKEKRKASDKVGNSVQQEAEIIEQAQSRQAQIIHRPKELSDIEIEAIQRPSTTATADATAPLAKDSCPKLCSCLLDYVDCSRLHLTHLPQLPDHINSL